MNYRGILMSEIKKGYSHFSKTGWEYDNTSINPLSQKYGIVDYWDRYYRTRTKIIPENLKEKKIIIFVGDSFTFGDGIKYKNTFCNIIDQKLSDDYCCINIAYPGNPNSKSLLCLTQWLNLCGSQIHMVIFGASIPHRRLIIHDDKDKKLYEDHIYDDKGKFNHFGKFRTFNSHHTPEHHFDEKYFTALLTLSNDVQDIFEFERDFLLLKGLGKLYNFKIYWWEWFMHKYHEKILSTIIEHTQSEDFKYIPINAPDIPKIPNDGHFSEEGNKIVSEIIMSEIRKDVEC